MKSRAKNARIREKLKFENAKIKNKKLFYKILSEIIFNKTNKDDFKKISKIVFIHKWSDFCKFMKGIKKYHVDDMLESNIWHDFGSATAGLITKTPKGFLILHNMEHYREESYYVYNFLKREERNKEEESLIKENHNGLQKYFHDEDKLRNALFWTNIIHELRHIHHYFLTWDNIKHKNVKYQDKEESEYYRIKYEEDDSIEFSLKVFSEIAKKFNNFEVI